ncbi:hypothetical protein MAR_017094, partial [Mya arenaria]
MQRLILSNGKLFRVLVRQRSLDLTTTKVQLEVPQSFGSQRKYVVTIELCKTVRVLTKRDDNSEKHGLNAKKKEHKHFEYAYDYKSKALYPNARQTSETNNNLRLLILTLSLFSSILTAFRCSIESGSLFQSTIGMFKFLVSFVTHLLGLKQNKRHYGYFGCDKCSKRDTWVDKVTFPEVDAPLRIDVQIDELQNEKHHLRLSPLAGLPISM